MPSAERPSRRGPVDNGSGPHDSYLIPKAATPPAQTQKRTTYRMIFVCFPALLDLGQLTVACPASGFPRFLLLILESKRADGWEQDEIL
jgi:hypothetical protein